MTLNFTRGKIALCAWALLAVIAGVSFMPVMYIAEANRRSPYICAVAGVAHGRTTTINLNPDCLRPFPGPGRYKFRRVAFPDTWTLYRFRVDGCIESQLTLTIRCKGEVP